MNSIGGVFLAPLRRFLSRFRVDRGPLRWWLIVAGMLLIRYSAGRFALGIVFVATGAVLHLLSKCYLRQSRAFLRRTGALTTRGPYRFTRNPFYLANLLAEVGLLVILGRWEIALPYLMLWGWVYRRTIRTEEAKLSQLCGATYAGYCKRVPRLFPLPWKYLAGRDATGPCFSWRNPNIAGGKELERSLRLLSYPLLFRLAAAFHEMRDWSLTGVSAATLLCAAGFVVMNALGWCSTRWMNRLKAPTGKTRSPLDEFQAFHIGGGA
jgi:protein-S-isoprenylcysteine O-methyltransferase Ste14